MNPRPRRTLLLFFFGVCLLGASRAVARQEPGTSPPSEGRQAGEETSEQRHEFIIKIVNFVILVGVLSYLSRRPLRDFFSQRSEGIRRALQEGERALADSQAQLAAVEDKLRHLEEQIAAFRASAEKEMEAERQRLRREAASDAAKILETARARLEAATRTAQLELRVSAAQEALKLAEQRIREGLDERARERLVSQFISSLPGPQQRN